MCENAGFGQRPPFVFKAQLRIVVLCESWGQQVSGFYAPSDDPFRLISKVWENMSKLEDAIEN